MMIAGASWMVFYACNNNIRRLFDAAAVDMLRKGLMYFATCSFENSFLTRISGKDARAPTFLHPGESKTQNSNFEHVKPPGNQDSIHWQTTESIFKGPRNGKLR